MDAATVDTKMWASPLSCRLIGWRRTKGKGETDGPSELDRKFDAMLAAVTGPGGRVIIDEDEQGRAIVANFPATLPLFFKTFCALNAHVEAVIAGEERLTFADLDPLVRPAGPRPRQPRDRQGRPGRHRDAQLPDLDPVLHGDRQGRSGRDLAQRLVAAGRAGACARSWSSRS